jgi:hypothetical protein
LGAEGGKAHHKSSPSKKQTNHAFSLTCDGSHIRIVGGGLCRYPEDRVPPHTSSKSRQGAWHVSTRCHASCSSGPRLPAEAGFGSGSRCPVRGSSGAATCPVALASTARHRAAMCPAAPAPAAQPGAAPVPPRVLRHQLSLPGSGQLWGRHVSCGLSSRYPARGSSGAATCALEAQQSACY